MSQQMGLTTVRMRQKMDEGWFFHQGDIPIRYAVKGGMTGGLADITDAGMWPTTGYSEGHADCPFSGQQWREVDLPHDWCVEGEFDRCADANHGYRPVGIGFYRKVFALPAEARGKRIWLEFDGVMRQSTVWVNGHLMGTHPSGYTSFYYDISDVARCGEDKDNVVLVRVDASEFEGWWYEGCGIYRHVWLTVTDALHVGHWGTYVTTPAISEDSCTVQMRTNVCNDGSQDRACTLRSTILDAQGAVVGRANSSATITSGTNLVLDQAVQLSRPELWSPDHPYLYRLISEVLDGERVVDHVETLLGIRYFEFTADRGFFLNGRPLLIKGTCNHQDFAGVGVALSDRLNEYKIERLKEMGANAYRCSHHPPTPELLDACDRLGMMVMDENRKLDSSPEGIANLESMLYRDRNHPSIILWSMENEESLEGTEMGARVVHTLVQRTHQIDPTRPTIAAMHKGWNEGGYSDQLDVVGYNYGQRDGQADLRDHAAHPERKIIGSESASCTTTRGVYEVDAEKGYCPAYGTLLEHWCCHVEKAWGDVIENPFLTGVFMWTGFDYRGEPTPFKWPCINSHFGIMDTCGYPKDVYYYMLANWTDSPMVHLFPHWNWPGREGQPIDVWVYSNADTVELLLNGESLGEQPVARTKHLAWSVPYEPGKLEARARRGGQLVAGHIVETTGPAARVRLQPDRVVLCADNADVSVVRVSILDAKGRVVPIADDEVRFSLEGPGRILGVGNGDPSSHEPDKATMRRAFNGHCLVLVQAGKQPGTIALRATATGLIGDETYIETQR